MKERFDCDLLAFAPHPDDAEICCGGLLASMSARGYRVGLADMTLGECASRGTVAIRQEEAKNAAAILGLTFRINAELPDCGISADGSALLPDGESQIERIVRIIRRHQPQTVVLPCQSTRHPDHRAASELLTRAVFLAGLRNFKPHCGDPHTALQAIYYQMRFAFRPSFIIDTTAFAEQKMAAIRAHKTQFGLDGNNSELPATLASSSLSLSSVVARDSYYGMMIGCPNGEPYLIKNVIRLDDPCEYFRQCPGKGALFFPDELTG